MLRVAAVAADTRGFTAEFHPSAKPVLQSIERIRNALAAKRVDSQQIDGDIELLQITTNALVKLTSTRAKSTRSAMRAGYPRVWMKKLRGSFWILKTS